MGGGGGGVVAFVGKQVVQLTLALHKVDKVAVLVGTGCWRGQIGRIVEHWRLVVG